MKYKRGDRVKIKSLKWYNENKDQHGRVACGYHVFTEEMSKFCGCTMIVCNRTNLGVMTMGGSASYWTDEMIEGPADGPQENMINTQISLLRKEIKDLEAQRVMLKLLIKEYTDKAETLRNMTWKPNFVPGTDELHFNKWKSFSIAANKKALNELVRQAKTTVKHLKFLQKDLTQLSLINKT